MKRINYQTVFLKKQQERRIEAGHLWVYSNEIDTAKSPLANFASGELITLKSHNNKFLGIGYINPHSLISIRLLTRKPQEIDSQFFIDKIQDAFAKRKLIFFQPYYRLIYGEGDFLPGLIVDRFADILIVQITTAGMEQVLNFIIDALVQIIKPGGIFLRNDSPVREQEQLPLYTKCVFGHVPDTVEIQENDVKFLVPIISGQKTGWFYDHRFNRTRLLDYVKDKSVLDIYSYIGAWGIQALNFGAEKATFIDSSKAALDLLAQNVASITKGTSKLNRHPRASGDLEKPCKSWIPAFAGMTESEKDAISKSAIINEDAIVALQKLLTEKQKFDVIIADPPAFIKRKKDYDNGYAAYLKLNTLALQLLNHGGVLFSSSCSMLLARDDLLNILRKAALKIKCDISILEQLHQSPDHPIHPAIKETEYLKGFICYKI